MAISMHSAGVPVYLKMLSSLSQWIDKAEAYAQAKNFDLSVLINARLAPDMLPFRSQVQIACDSAKYGVARLAGVDAPKFDDTEQSAAELKARIAKTLDWLKSVPPAQVDGTEAKAVSVPRRAGEALRFDGETFFKHYALPNFFFHVTTAYAILRHNGVALGKADFLGR